MLTGVITAMLTPFDENENTFLKTILYSTEDILAVIREKGGKNLEGVHLFDMYAGEQVPRGYVRLAFALGFTVMMTLDVALG